MPKSGTLCESRRIVGNFTFQRHMAAALHTALSFGIALGVRLRKCLERIWHCYRDELRLRRASSKGAAPALEIEARRNCDGVQQH